MRFLYAAPSTALAPTSFAADAADYPAPKPGVWIARNFRLHTGEAMPELRIQYSTVREPARQPMPMPHGGARVPEVTLEACK